MINGNGKETYRQIRKIKGNLYAGRIYFKAADTDGITVESAGTQEKLGFQAYEQDGVLYLRTNKIVIINSGMGKGSITVTMPEGQAFEEIHLFLKAAELHADRLCADKLEVENSAGQVCIQNFSVKEARFECGAGSLSGNGDAAERIEAVCGVGEVDLKLKGSRDDYNYDLECGIGAIKCGGDQYSGIGRAVHLDHHASKKIKAACSIGQINISYAAEL